MDFINRIINWVQNNWSVVTFGGMTLGGMVTMGALMFKQYIGTKTQGTKFESMYKTAINSYESLKELYEKEKEEHKEEISLRDAKDKIVQAGQNVMLDAIIKISLASKLDADDKASIVANVERLKDMEFTEIVTDVKTKTETIATNLVAESKENPAQTVVNISKSVETLLDKYSNKE